MMMANTSPTDSNKDWDAIHIGIHSVRLLPGYKASEFEKRVSAIILKRYAPICDECKKVQEAQLANPTQGTKSSFWSKLIGTA